MIGNATFPLAPSVAPIIVADVKAFLSHSSVNKPFVRPIAVELGRQYCVYDEKSFETGEQFKKSIETGLDESSVFVFFASKESIESVWVNFELNEAWFKVLQKQITKSLVYILDTSLDHSDLPNWLQRAKASRVNSPKVIAREIQDHLNDLAREKQQPYFIGRTADIEKMQRLLSPVDGSAPPRAAGVIGLPGIGRRAFIKHTSRSLLNIRRHLTIRIQDGDSISDLALKIADQIEPYTSSAGLERIDHEIRKASDLENINRILTDLRLSIANGELPVFLDDGGLLNEEGRIEDPIRTILAGLSANDEAYVFIVSSRRPNQLESTPLPIIQLQPLKDDEVKILITSIANASNLRLKANEISELAGYTGGFPPACYYAIQLARDYGLAAVIADKYRLVEFRTSAFVKLISERKLTQEQTKVLQILAEYSPLPLPVIGKSLGYDPKKMSELLTRLVDYCLAYPDEHGFYRISDPIRDAVMRMHRMMSKTEHSAISKALQGYLETEGDDRPKLDLSRVLFKAATQSNNAAIAEHVIHLANDVIQLAEQMYHGRDYAAAVTLGREAVALRPKSFNARSYLIRALVHEEQWGEATEELNKLSGIAAARDIYYLQGFLERKRRNIDRAIHLFEMAEKAGRSGVAIKRELASCYFIKRDYKRALEQIETVMRDSGDNAFVVDLWAQVATRMGDEVLARKALARLEAIDSSGFYHHRASTVEIRFGDITKAREEAAKAVETEERPYFEMLSQLALCEIGLGNLVTAEDLLARLDNEFRRVREDIRINLRCKLELARKKYAKVIALSEKNPNKEDRFYKDVRRKALAGELASAALTDDVRIKYKHELERLNVELMSADAQELETLY